jgi:hypothetical protein
MTEPGISPAAARSAAGLMSMSAAPSATSRKASGGVSRSSRSRAAARISSMVRAPAGLVITTRRHPRFPG